MKGKKGGGGVYSFDIEAVTLAGWLIMELYQNKVEYVLFTQIMNVNKGRRL